MEHRSAFDERKSDTAEPGLSGDMRDHARVLLHHFSENGEIMEFVPHVPRTNPEHRPAVWAIDEAHAPLYWFPRDCPRVTAWPRDDHERAAFEHELGTSAPRVHAIEFGWLRRVSTARLFRYDLDASDFEPWSEASGQWISDRTVTPIGVTPVGGLLGAHERAGIELRLVSSLRPLADRWNDDRWDFSFVRLSNAAD